MNNSIQARLENAQKLLRERKLAPALFVVREVLDQNPDNVEALILLVEIHLHSGNPSGAVELIGQLFDMDIASFDNRAQLVLGNLCFSTEQYFKAAELFELLKAREEASPRMLYQLGCALIRIGELEGAEQNLRACVKIHPEVADPYLQLGHVHKALGDMDKASQQYKKFIALSQANKGTGYWSLADLKQYQFSGDEIIAIRKELDSVGRDFRRASPLYFTLGKAAEQQGDYALAYDYYSKGNSVQARLKPFLVKQFGQLVSELKTISGQQRSPTEQYEMTPIFIVGLPRSGSTLIEQILSAHSHVQATDELPFVPKMAWQMGMKGGYVERLGKLSGREQALLRQNYMDSVSPYLKTETGYFIDKCPGNFMHIGLIKRIMPNAIIIDSRRDPRDNAVSAFRQLFHMGNEFSSSLEGIYQYYKYYLELMDHWQAAYPGQVKLVEYEKLVSNPDDEIGALLDFCNLENETGCYEFYKNKRAVMTPSVGQVNQPMYTSSVGQWRHYEDIAGAEMVRLASLITDDSA